MITEEHVMATLADSNPVPDVEEIDLVQVGTASYLATLEQRSSQVTELDTKGQDNREKNKKNVVAFLVAAAVVIVAGIGFMVLTPGDEVLAAEDFVGIWVTNNSDFNTQFREDGTYATWDTDHSKPFSTFSDLREQQLVTSPVESGEWGLEGTEFTFNTDFSVNNECQATRGRPGRYEVELLVDPAGAVKWTVIDDPCQLRIEVLQSGPTLPK